MNVVLCVCFRVCAFPACTLELYLNLSFAPLAFRLALSSLSALPFFSLFFSAFAQVFWGYLLVRVLFKLIVNGHVEDDRSDDEAEEDAKDKKKAP